MIVEMTSVSLVGPMADRDAAVRAVAEAGVLHVVERGEVPDAPPQLVERRARVQRVLGALPGVPAEGTERWPGPEQAEAMLERLGGLLDERDAVLAEAERLEVEQAAREPWGDIEPEALRQLAEHGVFVQGFEGRRAELDEGVVGDAAWARLIDRPGGRVRVFTVAPAELTLPLAALEPPSRTRARLDAERESAGRRLADIDRTLADEAAGFAVLAQYLRWLDDRLAVARIRDRLDDSQPLFVLEGHCPTERMASLRAALGPCDVVLLTHAPGEGDDVPIALRNGPIVRTFEPLVAAFKLPTYGELDPTPLVAPFMGLFFGLCLATWATARCSPPSPAASCFAVACRTRPAWCSTGRWCWAWARCSRAHCWAMCSGCGSTSSWGCRPRPCCSRWSRTLAGCWSSRWPWGSCS